jgi:hypothetical protein
MNELECLVIEVAFGLSQETTRRNHAKLRQLTEINGNSSGVLVDTRVSKKKTPVISQR